MLPRKARITKSARITIIGLIAMVAGFFIYSNIARWNPETNIKEGEGSELSIPDQIHVKPSTERINRSIELATAYLARNQMKSGQFVYRVNTNPEVRIENKYNMLRHAGTVYALGMYNNYAGKTINYCPNILTGIDFLTKDFILPLPEYPALKGIWTFDRITHNGKPNQLKLGGTGLGLVAMSYAHQCENSAELLETMKSMGDFLVFMQKANGGFYSKYYPDSIGRDDSWTSLYYPGEAALGLMCLYELDPQEKWINAAVKSMNYLATTRKGKKVTEADHWALIASEKILVHFDNNTTDIDKDVILRHAKQIVNSIVITRADFPLSSPYFGCLTQDGRSTPTSTRLEGLIAAYRFIPLNDEEKEFLKAIIDNGIYFLQNSLIETEPWEGGMTRAGVTDGAVQRQFNIPLDNRDTEIRIDYVQHALSAFIGFAELD